MATAELRVLLVVAAVGGAVALLSWLLSLALDGNERRGPADHRWQECAGGEETAHEPIFHRRGEYGCPLCEAAVEAREAHREWLRWQERCEALEDQR